MAQAFVVTLERDLPDAAASAAYAKARNGKALFRESDRLDAVARRRGATPPTALLSEDPAALRAEMEAQGFDPSKMRIPPELWFDPAEGLRTVRALAEHVATLPNDFKQPSPILRDLKAVEALRVAAEAAGVKFHLSNVEG